MEIAICLLIAAALLQLLIITKLSARLTSIMHMLSKAAERIASNERRIDDAQNYITKVKTELKLKMQDMDEQFNAARELIEAAREAVNEEAAAARSAQETERRMQDGINSILNYSSQKDDQVS